MPGTVPYKLTAACVGALQPQNLHHNGAAKQTNHTIPLTSAVETLSALIVAPAGGFVDVVAVEYEASEVACSCSPQ